MKKIIVVAVVLVATILSFYAKQAFAMTQAECTSSGGSCYASCYYTKEIGTCDISGMSSKCCGSEAKTSSSTAGEDTGGLVPCKDSCTLCHIVVGFQKIYTYLLGILFTVCMLGVTIAGVFYMISTGDKNLMGKAKQALTLSLTAFAIALGGWLIVTITLTALGYTNVGYWWQFSCDTTRPPAGSISPGTGTGLANVAQSTLSGDAAASGGDCAGITVRGVNKDLCKYASNRLNNFATCVKGKVGGNLAITSIYRSTSPGCHSGGVKCKGTTQAFDFGGSKSGDMAAMDRIAEASRACGADTVIWRSTAYWLNNSKASFDHYDHVHVSVNNKECGCDFLRSR